MFVSVCKSIAVSVFSFFLSFCCVWLSFYYHLCSSLSVFAFAFLSFCFPFLSSLTLSTLSLPIFFLPHSLPSPPRFLLHFISNLLLSHSSSLLSLTSSLILSLPSSPSPSLSFLPNKPAEGHWFSSKKSNWNKLTATRNNSQKDNWLPTSALSYSQREALKTLDKNARKNGINLVNYVMCKERKGVKGRARKIKGKKSFLYKHTHNYKYYRLQNQYVYLYI